MNSQRIVPLWWRPKSKLKPMPIKHDWYLLASLRTYRTLGLLLSIMLAAILLSGCCRPDAIYRKPAPYPLPDSTLMAPPRNQDLGERFLSPSNNAKPASTQPQRTLER